MYARGFCAQTVIFSDKIFPRLIFSKDDLLVFLKITSSYLISTLQTSPPYRPDPPAETYKSLPLPPPLPS
jgi:hypothetical protein